MSGKVLVLHERGWPIVPDWFYRELERDGFRPGSVAKRPWHIGSGCRLLYDFVRNSTGMRCLSEFVFLDFFADMEGKYKVVTLCGSTRFKDAFVQVQKELSLQGCIVISVGLFGHCGDGEVWQAGVKEMLDDMHLRKIDMADAVFVINVDGYVGESTRREIAYARSQGKEVRYLCPEYRVSFPPVVDERAKVLVLGTMPGETSLSKYEYYGSGSNHFWKILARLFNRGREFPDYGSKLACLRENGIALWDTLSACRREGSRDSRIRNPLPNDIPALLGRYPGIRTIIFNGKTARSFFQGEIPDVRLCVAPATSSLNAHYSLEEKTVLWKACFQEGGIRMP